MPIDFAMTYPCFVPLITQHEPLTHTSLGSPKHVAIVLFTDDDLSTRFMPHTKARGRIVFSNADDIAAYLDSQATLPKSGTPITHVLIDPEDPSKQVRDYPIAEFVPHILAQG